MNKKIIAAILALLPISHTYAAGYNYEDMDEGQLIFKLRGFVSRIDGKQKGITTPTKKSDQLTPIGSLMNLAYGADGATQFFIADHFAAELSFGAALVKVKKTALQNVFNNYGTGDNEMQSAKPVYMIPLTVIAQYHPFPFGGISPSIGAGMHFTYLHTLSKQFKLKQSIGSVIQASLDLWARDDTSITIDLKHYFMESKLSYRPAFINQAGVRNLPEVRSKLRINPTVFSVGVGFKL